MKLNNADLFFIWDTLEDRRTNCIDIVYSDKTLDTEDIRMLLDTIDTAERLQGIITAAMED